MKRLAFVALVACGGGRADAPTAPTRPVEEEKFCTTVVIDGKARAHCTATLSECNALASGSDCTRVPLTVLYEPIRPAIVAPPDADVVAVEQTEWCSKTRFDTGAIAVECKPSDWECADLHIRDVAEQSSPCGSRADAEAADVGSGPRPPEVVEVNETAEWAASLSKKNHGPKPSDPSKLTRAWLKRTLKDPYSAKFGKVTKPKKAEIIIDATEKKALLGWSVCADVNAKNSYGAYVGVHTYWFFIVKGVVVEALDMDDPDTLSGDIAADC